MSFTLRICTWHAGCHYPSTPTPGWSSQGQILGIHYFFVSFTLFTLQVREAAKTIPPLMARPLRGRGGVKAGPLKKRTFLHLFFYIVAIENKNYLTLENLLKYGHITLKFVGRYFYLVVLFYSICFQRYWRHVFLGESSYLGTLQVQEQAG